MGIGMIVKNKWLEDEIKKINNNCWLECIVKGY